MGHSAQFEAVYQAISPVTYAKPGSLEYFLTERYCLYVACKNGELYRADCTICDGTLQVAEADIRTNSMQNPSFGIPDTQPLLHFAKSIETLEWTPRSCLKESQ